MKIRLINARARLVARRHGLKAKKGPLREDPVRPNRGGFMLIDERSNFIVAGRRFDLTAEAVIEYCGHIREGTAPYRGWR